MKKINKIIENKLKNKFDSDFGWLNFLSGIMISSSINTLTGFCTSEGASVYVFSVSVCSGISSGLFFTLYQTLNKVKHDMEREVDLCGNMLTSRDMHEHRIKIWQYCITKEIDSISSKIIWASIMGILGLIGFIVCYCDNNY